MLGLADLFDQKYESLEPSLDVNGDCAEQFLCLNRELFDMLETTVDLELVKRLYATQLTAKGEKQLLDHNRVYYRLLRKLVLPGAKVGSADR